MATIDLNVRSGSFEHGKHRLLYVSTTYSLQNQICGDADRANAIPSVPKRFNRPARWDKSWMTPATLSVTKPFASRFGQKKLFVVSLQGLE